jgi:Tfp pilus assembly protein PilX
MRAYMQPIRLLKHNRRGAVLIVGLFTLALLSLLGAAVTTTSRTDVSITGNAKTLQEAFYAAEVGLAMGEMRVADMNDRLGLNDLPAGFYVEKEKEGPLDWAAHNWDDEDSVLMNALDLPNGLDHLYERPRYMIEQIDKKKIPQDYKVGRSIVHGTEQQASPVFWFNIYAKGTGSSSKTQSVLQSIFAPRFD